jgi:acyl carrier protein
VDPDAVLSTMKANFEGSVPPEKLQHFAETKAVDLFEESIDVINFLFYLEDELGPKIDASQIGPAMANMTFGELATELCRVLNKDEAAGPTH